jgi:predicted ATP-dependent serine protease
VIRYARRSALAASETAPVAQASRCASCGWAQRGGAQCQACGKWSMLESAPSTSGDAWAPKSLAKVAAAKVSRVDLRDEALNALFDGGPVRSCSYLFSGPPGSGKSSWALQATQFFERPIYLASEETEDQIKLRANRFRIQVGHVAIADVAMHKNDFEVVARNITDEYDAMIVDSSARFRTDDSGAAPGSPLQTNSVIALATDIAHKLSMVAFVIGHVNADGEQSGLVANRHDADGVIEMEGDEDKPRTMRMSKHRHGAVGVKVECRMTARGLDDFKIVKETRERAVSRRRTKTGGATSPHRDPMTRNDAERLRKRG